MTDAGNARLKDHPRSKLILANPDSPRYSSFTSRFQAFTRAGDSSSPSMETEEEEHKGHTNSNVSNSSSSTSAENSFSNMPSLHDMDADKKEIDIILIPALKTFRSLLINRDNSSEKLDYYVAHNNSNSIPKPLKLKDLGDQISSEFPGLRELHRQSKQRFEEEQLSLFIDAYNKKLNKANNDLLQFKETTLNKFKSFLGNGQKLPYFEIDETKRNVTRLFQLFTARMIDGMHSISREQMFNRKTALLKKQEIEEKRLNKIVDLSEFPEKSIQQLVELEVNKRLKGNNPKNRSTNSNKPAKSTKSRANRPTNTNKAQSSSNKSPKNGQPHGRNTKKKGVNTVGGNPKQKKNNSSNGQNSQSVKSKRK
jgi:hypothetical protein